MSIFSALAPSSSKSIQKEYVDKRLRQLKKDSPAHDQALKDEIVRLQRQYGLNPATPWTDTLVKLLVALRTADLTINLDAWNWFMKAYTPNTFPTYKQTYERADKQADGSIVVKDDPFNVAKDRTSIDDETTLPDEWANAHPWSQRKRLHNALAAKPGMTHTTAVKDAQDKVVTPGTATITNKHFKPKAKEVFAALNYARRQHGANTTYGYSHIVLNPEFRKRALYYPADTFYIRKQGVKSQASYDTISSLLLPVAPNKAHAFVDDLWKQAYRGINGPDTHSGMLMIEAHIFKRVKIATDVKKLVLARQRASNERPFTDSEWDSCITRAHDWSRRFGGIPVQVLD